MDMNGMRTAMPPPHAGEVKGLKAQCNGLADAAQAEKFELLAAKQENERLQDQIVQVRVWWCDCVLG